MANNTTHRVATNCVATNAMDTWTVMGVDVKKPPQAAQQRTEPSCSELWPGLRSRAAGGAASGRARAPRSELLGVAAAIEAAAVLGVGKGVRMGYGATGDWFAASLAAGGAVCTCTSTAWVAPIGRALVGSGEAVNQSGRSACSWYTRSGGTFAPQRATAARDTDKALAKLAWVPARLMASSLVMPRC